MDNGKIRLVYLLILAQFYQPYSQICPLIFLVILDSLQLRRSLNSRCSKQNLHMLHPPKNGLFHQFRRGSVQNTSCFRVGKVGWPWENGIWEIQITVHKVSETA